MAPQLAGSHILDHTLAQRADGGISAHGELLLSEGAHLIFLRTGLPTPAVSALSTRYRPRQRAPPRSGYRGSDLVLWHLATKIERRQRVDLRRLAVVERRAGVGVLQPMADHAANGRRCPKAAMRRRGDVGGCG